MLKGPCPVVCVRTRVCVSVSVGLPVSPSVCPSVCLCVCFCLTVCVFCVVRGVGCVVGGVLCLCGECGWHSLVVNAADTDVDTGLPSGSQRCGTPTQWSVRSGNGVFFF